MTPDERRRRFEEFAIEWTSKVRGIAYRSGFRGIDLSDCVQEVLTFLFEKDYLSRYDESRGKLSTYMYTLALMRVLDYKRNMGKLSGGEFNASEQMESDAFTFPDADYASVLSRIEMRTALAETYAWLSQLPSPDGQQLARLLSDIVGQVQESGRVSFEEIAERRGLSRRTLSNQRKRLAESAVMQEFRMALKDTPVVA